MADQLEEELIYLEADEEITSVVDRLRESEARSIRLVVPKGALVTQSLVSLKLLKREADHLKKELALVSSDSTGVHLSRQAGLTVYAKPKDTSPIVAGRPHLSPEPDEEPVSEEELPAGIEVHHYRHGAARPAPLVSGETESESFQPTASRPAKSAVTFRGSGFGRLLRLGFILASLALAGYLVFFEFAPRATIAVTLATEKLDQSVTVTSTTQASQPDPSNAIIPGRSLETEVTVEESAPATGKKEVGAKARATLNLFNYWDSNPQEIAAGTTVKAADGTEFITLAAATIPGASTTLKQGQVTTTPGKATAEIEAVQPGPNANGKTGTFTIPSLPLIRQDKIYGESLSATSGGTSREITIVTNDDRDNLKKTAVEKAQTEAKDVLTSQANPSRLLDNAASVEVKEETYSAEVDSEAEKVTLKLKAKVAAIVFADADLKTVSQAVLNKAIPSGRKLVIESALDKLVVTARTVDIAAGQLEIEAHYLTRTALAIDEPNEIIDRLTSLPVSDAQATLAGLAGVKNVTITARPRWLKVLPKHASQITFAISYADPEPAPQTSPQ